MFRVLHRITAGFLTVPDVRGGVLRLAVGQDRRFVVRPCHERLVLAINARLILRRTLSRLAGWAMKKVVKISTLRRRRTNALEPWQSEQLSLGSRVPDLSSRAARVRPGLSGPSCSGAVHRIMVEHSQNVEIAAHGRIVGSHCVDNDTSQDRSDHTGLVPVSWPADLARCLKRRQREQAPAKNEIGSFSPHGH